MPSTLEQLNEIMRDVVTDIERRRAELERAQPSFYHYPYPSFADLAIPSRIETGTATEFTIAYDQASPYEGTWIRQPDGRVTLNRPQRPEGQRRQQMKVSIKPEPFSEAESRELKQFYREILENGFATAPNLFQSRAILWVDGLPVRIKRDGTWNETNEAIYIGYREDEGYNKMTAPQNRLAVIAALMGLTGHMSDPVLIALFERRLVKVLAGVYSQVVAPLGERSNGEPVARMAWSDGGGVAAWLDGKWVSPVSGSEVDVSGWVVVETGEGQAVVEGLASIASNSSQERQLLREDFDRWLGEAEWYETRTPDGRPIVSWGLLTEQNVRDWRLPDAIQLGGPNLEVTQNEAGHWGIAPIWAPVSPSPTVVPTLEEANRQLEEAVRLSGNLVRALATLPDGRRAWTAYHEEDARSSFGRFKTAAAIPFVRVEQIVDLALWAVVSMPASMLPSSPQVAIEAIAPIPF